MKVSEALSILGIGRQTNLTIDEVKKAYRKAALKYHPDRNPAGLEMMKAVNSAWDYLQEVFSKSNSEFLNNEKATDEKQTADYGDELNAALNALIQMQGLTLEICGIWVWITGDTKTHKEALKQIGCRWAPKKKAWYFRPSFWERSAFSRGKLSMAEIRLKYGSEQPGMATKKAIKKEAA